MTEISPTGIYTPAEAAESVGVKLTFIKTQIKEGRLTAYRLGAKVLRIKGSDLRKHKEFAGRRPYVIEYRGEKVGSPKKAVRAVFKRAGIEGQFLGLHALRHTLATSAAAAGIDMRKVQRMLGHDDIRTTESVYVEFQRGALSEVAQVGDGHIKRIAR